MLPTDPDARSIDPETNASSKKFRDEEFGPVEPFGLPLEAQPLQNPAGAGQSDNFKTAPVNGVPEVPASPTANAESSTALVAVPGTPGQAPSGFRVRLTGDVHPDDGLQDAAILAYEYERRRSAWWHYRRFGLIGLPSLAILLLIIGLFGLIINQAWLGICITLFLLTLIGWVLFAAYCWLTLPRVVSFGRAYRRLVSVPLERGGIAWCDSAQVPPDFLALRNSFFTLYQDSSAMHSHTQPTTNAEDNERKKQTLKDLKALLDPLNSSSSEVVPTPYIPRERTVVLDRLELEPLEWPQLVDLNYHSLPQKMQGLNTPPELSRVTRDIETYANTKAEGAEISLVPISEEPLPTPLHRQINTRVQENLSLVSTEIDRWRQRTTREKAFHAGLIARYKEAEDQVRLGYERTALALEEEIHPAATQLQADATYFQTQLENFYSAQREVIESRRDSVLSKLEQEHQELEIKLDQSSDEQSLMQAEFRGLNDQRVRLENSTDNRFETLKNQLAELLRKSYSFPAGPIFRSDYPEEPSALTAEDCLQQLAELRAETRLATSAVNNALNRFARLRFEPLDELARLESQISGVTKWQATSYLVNLINFKQSGQLLALAGEVSEAAGVYLDSVADFDRLNRRWCALEASIRNLGLVAYNNRLQEAQEYLLGLSQVAISLHSSLISSSHSPEMARPTTFQNIYEQAAGLQRELEELGALAGSISHTQDRLNVLEEETSQLRANLQQNEAETERVQTDASVKLYEISQKLKKMVEKLEELKTVRLKHLREHIDQLAAEQKAVDKNLKTGITELNDVAATADKILRRHILQAEQLQEATRQLHRGLENTIAQIVRDFEDSTVPDRHISQPTDLLIPVWFFQFKERPLWNQRVLGFASCYTGLELLPLPESIPIETTRKERASLWRYLASLRPATFYRLQEEPQLETLIGAQLLDYPAGRVEITFQQLEKLVAEDWLSRWLFRTMKISFK